MSSWHPRRSVDFIFTALILDIIGCKANLRGILKVDPTYSSICGPDRPQGQCQRSNAKLIYQFAAEC
jgi:hypothetical protein